MATKFGMAEVKLYLSGLPNVVVKGKLNVVAELQILSIVPTLKSTVGATVTVTVLLTKLVQLFSVQVAVYEVVTLGETGILKPVEPLLQATIPVQLLAVKVAFCPEQMLVLPAKTGGFTVVMITTISLLAALVPHEFVQTAE